MHVKTLLLVFGGAHTSLWQLEESIARASLPAHIAVVSTTPGHQQIQWTS